TAPTATTVSANPATTNTATAVQLTATTIAPNNTIGVGPTGMMTFSANGSAIGTVAVVPTASSSVSNGPYSAPSATATLSHTFASTGNYMVTAAYSGDSNYVSSTSG